MNARTMTGDMLRKLINNGVYNSREEMQMKLDIFLMWNRITIEEYQELSDLLEQREVKDETEEVEG